MWANYFHYECAIVNDTLFINGDSEADRMTPAFSLPIGAMSLAESIALLERYFRNNGLKLFGILRTNALNVNDFVIHGYIENSNSLV